MAPCFFEALLNGPTQGFLAERFANRGRKFSAMLDHLVLEGRYRHFLKGVQGGLADDHAVEKSFFRVSFGVLSLDEEFVASRDVQVIEVRSCIVVLPDVRRCSDVITRIEVHLPRIQHLLDPGVLLQ